MFYDLHVHSCLSPCGDDDMTVNNIVNMACLKGLDIIALTDHNSCKNCPPFLEVAKKAGILALPGMEINTAEEVHVVCLFFSIDDAMAFDAYVYAHLPDIHNKPEIFGEQRIVDADDHPTGIERKLLINATDISYFELPELVKRYKGVFFPAHIDRDSFSLLSNMGFVPEDIVLPAYELAKPENKDAVIKTNPLLQDLPLFINSDAHYLENISEAEQTLTQQMKKVLRLT